MDAIHATRADRGEHLLVGTDATKIGASGRDTSGGLLVLEGVVPPGGGPPVLFRFPQGEFEIGTPGADGALSTVRVAAGDAVSVPSMIKSTGQDPTKERLWTTRSFTRASA